MRSREPGDVLANHRIERVIGRGGMGVVYLATDLRLKRQVALKVIAPEHQDAEFKMRFERECELAASLDHPNVIPIYQAGEVDGDLYLTMRSVEGTDLKAMIDSRGPLAPEAAARIVLQIGAALDEAHSAGLVHRDVKPANVLVRVGEDGEHVYLTDFGLTKRIESETALTATGGFVGTVDYVAPEQVSGERQDARTDVYALGAVLYHALTGKVPFPRENPLAAIVAHVNDPPPSPRDAMPSLPPGLDDVVRRGMAKSPDDRFLSAGDLGRSAVAAARGEPGAQAERSVAVGKAAPATVAATMPAQGAATRPATPPQQAPAPTPTPVAAARAQPPAPPPHRPPPRNMPPPQPPLPVSKAKSDHNLWFLWPLLSVGALAAVGFSAAVKRNGRRDLLVWGVLYSVIAIASLVVLSTAPQNDNVANLAGACAVGAWVVSVAHCLRMRYRLPKAVR